MPGNNRAGTGHRAYRRQQASLKRRTHDEHLPCAWCGQPIDTSLPDGHPLAFTADHPTAIANGGALAGQVLEPMHRRCNSLKGKSADTEIWAAT